MGCRHRLIDLLDTQGVAYETHIDSAERHPLARLPGQCAIQILVADHHPAMFVVPADGELDLHAARQVVGKDVRYASDDELARLFPDCEPGAIPAFGNWYGMPVYIDEGLASQRQISFSTGIQGEQVTLPTATVERLARAVPVALVDHLTSVPA